LGRTSPTPAGVQALAWARTLGRYGERVSTHQATLDLVGSLRTNLFARALHLPRDRVAELRSSELLGRITIDSDAVENLLLRSSFPLLAAIASLIGTPPPSRLWPGRGPPPPG
jgi:ATP-binding cassette subfamily C protein CydC